jgi:hypothetical protein
VPGLLPVRSWTSRRNPLCASRRNGLSTVSAVRWWQEPRGGDLAAAVAIPADRDRGDLLERDLARRDRQPLPGGRGDRRRTSSYYLGGRPSRALIIVALLALAWAWQSEFDFATESTPA